MNMTIPGRATLEGTQRYQKKHANHCSPDHFRASSELIASSIGIGTYLGVSDEQTDDLVNQAIIESVRRGVNLIDTAIGYRNQQAERCVGNAIRYLVQSAEVSRDELIICTKGGFLTHENPEYVDWFRQHYINSNSFTINEKDFIENCHCIHPEYLREQIDLSLENLGVQTIDIYYIHNPEVQLSEIDPSILYERLRDAFEVMEEAVDSGKIAAYGLATWDGLRVPANSDKYLNLARIKSIAREVARNKVDSFRFIEFPYNMSMLEALLLPNQNVQGEQIPLLEAAYRLGLTSIASASLCQAQVNGQIPDTISIGFDENFKTDCQRALQYTRSVPGLLTALVGMKAPNHVQENLIISAYPLLAMDKFTELTHDIIEVLKRMKIVSGKSDFDLSHLSCIAKK
ncbi:putative oxidoreductase, aryl-alcohol dehydrogenase like protein [Cylindrospermum stagnale PCC 7417]|uniref:Putative oxidoreductase, aryl-alcohol dehydrogenase like protein n=1 Tax=Cylindrospermum stagnale PCC 7417 TaxID=56107 RepID=K9WWB0_9NOST|nr:aldo/keto reductase [Cylindrospermum stagnale]AFZ23817.1 putative oxidoreductase, aryl-alcohol dehydrogenase like protein [Cylindrospermum stagnale PCC 7417]